MGDWINRFSLDGRTALVTGASKGIGAEICAVYADAGANIIASGRDADGLKEVEAAVTAKGRKCVTIPCELADVADVREMGHAAMAEAGTIDILVNNAGMARVGPALDFPVEDWDLLMAVNVRSAFLLSQIVAPKMIEQRWGKIVMVSSQTSVIALEDHAAYAASKGAMNSLTKSLMAEWARHNIQVNAICPTIVMTPMGVQVWSDEAKSGPMLAKTPLGRFGKPVEIADIALFLASPAAELINGSLIMAEGGFTSM